MLKLNERKATCKICGQPQAKGTAWILRTRRTGKQANGTGGCLCNTCKTRLFGYTWENEYHVGKPNKDDYTFGQEFEASYGDEQARIELALNHIMPTSDCTVSVEFKSPIQHGFNSLAKWVVTMDALIEEGHLSFADTRAYKCGTHFHVGHSQHINNTTIQWVRRFYNSLFIDLSEEMKAHPVETERLFGRNFNQTRWANPITMTTYAEEHTNFINVQHNHTLEFRLAKYQNGEQYMNCAHFCHEVAKVVVEGFIKQYDESMKATEKRAMARECGQKMVKLFRKYTEQ